MSEPLSLHRDTGAAGRTAAVLERLFPAPRSFDIRLWDGSSLPAAGRPAFTLVLNHAGSLRRMFSPPIELALGEAYIYGDFDLEGDLVAAAGLLDTASARSVTPLEVASLLRDLWALPRPAAPALAGRGPARLSGERHSRERDRVAVQYHYDVGDEFYGLWLDRNRQYSCAYFAAPDDDLDAAQERKLEHLCRKLRLQPGERLLDIGCGWGGLALYAAERYSAQVLGVTLSRNQAAFAERWIAGRRLAQQVSVRLQDYRDLGDQAFDKIVSVGMYEHVGRARLPEYFAQTYRLLRPGGLFLNHGISARAGVELVASGAVVRRAVPGPLWQRWLAQRLLGAGSFVQRYIFPDGELTPVSAVNVTAERAGFEVRDVENLREHYALTLRQWVRRLEQQRAEAVRLAGEVTYRTWHLYLSASAHGFEAGHINVCQTLLSRPEHGDSRLPLTRADLYA